MNWSRCSAGTRSPVAPPVSEVDTCYVVAYSAQAAMELGAIYSSVDTDDEVAIQMIRAGYVNGTPEDAERNAREFEARMVGLPWKLYVWELKSGVFIP